jgi:hypothetical protein
MAHIAKKITTNITKDTCKTKRNIFRKDNKKTGTILQSYLGEMMVIIL